MMNFLRKQMKWVMAIIVIAFLLSTFLMYEGRSTRRTPERNADGTMSDYEVAQINGRSLMRSELERRLRDYLSNYSSRSAESLDMPAIYQAVLDQVILEAQIAKEVDESGIRVSDAEADQAMKNYADTYYPTRETFYQALANTGIRVEDYKKNLARQIAVERLFTNAIGDVNISEDKAVEFYDTMKTLIYSRPEGFMVHAANFGKKEDAEVLREKLTAGGSWDVIVSNDELASQDVINITREPVFLPATALKTGAFSVLDSLDVGEISPVFEVTSYDFAVGFKAEHVESTVTPYDEVSADIKTLLTQQEQRNRLSAYEESLRNKAQVIINDEALFARTPVTSRDAVIPELVIDDIVEASGDTKTETAPAIVVEEVKEEEKEAESSTEEAKPEVETVKEEAKPETEAVKEEAKTETEAVKEEAKTETETVTEEAKPETEAVKEEAKTETETVTEEAKPETETVKEEAKTETETVTEEAKPETEAVKEEAKTEAETVTEEAKSETEAVKEEAKTETKAVKEEAKSETEAVIEEANPEAEAVTEEAKPEETSSTEEVKPEVKEETKPVVENAEVKPATETSSTEPVVETEVKEVEAEASPDKGASVSE